MERFDPKQISEGYYLEFDFTKEFGASSDEDIDSVVVTVIDESNGDEDVTATFTDPTNQYNSGKKAYVWLRKEAGTDGHNYKITVEATGDGTPASTYELEGRISVREK